MRNSSTPTQPSPTAVEITYPLAANSWDEQEPAAIREVVDSGRLTMGERVRRFETAFAETVGSRHALMANSGSSANLLMIAALCYRRSGALRPGDQVIVPAVSWGTTFYPVHQHGLELRFVDVSRNTFNIDPSRVEAAITPRTRAVFATDLLGGVCDFEALAALCDAHDLVLVEDACESLGATYCGRAAGTFGLCGTYSTYFSHHLNTIEGGMVVTDDEECFQILRALRAHGWTRDLPADNLIHPKSDEPFYNLFCFVLPGYNLRPTEISGAVGLCQLQKLDRMVATRRANAELYRRLFGDLDGVSLQRPLGDSSWFSFALVLEGRLSGRRDRLVGYLREHGVDTRPVVAGNFTRNPVIRHLRHTIAGPLPVAEKLDRDGFLVGNHHYPLDRELQRLRQLLEDFR